MAAQFFFIGLRSREWGWIADKTKIAVPTNDGQIIYQLCISFMKTCWQQEPVDQVQVTALDPKPQDYQQDMFAQTNCFLNKKAANDIVDTINNRYGEFCIAPARLLLRSNMPNVIAPAWKPTGHRQTIV